MQTQQENGIASMQSNYPFDQTVERFLAILEGKNIKVFAVVDHSGEAAKAGLEMRPTKVVIFGNPKAGTPLMIECPSIAIDLPLKLLIAEDAEGQAWVSYNSPEYLQTRYNLPENLIQNIAVIEALANQTVK